MADLTSLLLPNLNLDALTGLFIAIAGLLVLGLGTYLSGIPFIGRWVKALGAILILGGLAYWVGTSIIQDILADQRILTIVLVIIGLLTFGVILFTPTTKKPKRR
jgi:hypothetical protein